MSLQEGEAAPEFAMETDDRGSVKLGDFAGKPLVLYFYPKDDTSGCTKEAIAFTGLSGEFEAAGATILGVSPDTVKKHAKFREKHDLSVSLGADESHEVAERYGVWVDKSMSGKKYMGIERSTFLIGADGTLAKIWRKVKVPGHAEAVLDAVKAM